MKRLSSHILLVMIVSLMLAGCTVAPIQPATPEPSTGSSTTLANPASVNCVNQGGTLTIATNPSGGQYGICLFEDNRQCEEWALLRGNCPVGGVKVTGYSTQAATYCAITGGTYEITGNSGAEDEQGTCTLPGGKVCDAWDYFNGACSAN